MRTVLVALLFVLYLVFLVPALPLCALFGLREPLVTAAYWLVRLGRRILECEMIDREVSLWYYKKMAQGYIQGLHQGMERGEIRKLPAVFLARSLMGLIHFIGLKWIVWNTGSQPGIPPHILKEMLTLIIYGLKP